MVWYLLSNAMRRTSITVIHISIQKGGGHGLRPPQYGSNCNVTAFVYRYLEINSSTSKQITPHMPTNFLLNDCTNDKIELAYTIADAHIQRLIAGGESQITESLDSEK